MYVIGTAGHIDHGKSTLVKALTGIDPDRLQEEKDRGMTIDLGFAWLRLPSGREVSIVDVPGHERFIKNMLAGVGGIDLALLVIAADEGFMPQTEEHLAILELLRVKRAVVALTKADLVEADWLALVEDEVTERLTRSRLAEAPVVTVSAITRAGLPALLAELDRALDETPPKPNRGRPRLPIDRVFSISGFGTVVTGTLIDGELAVGQELEIQPGGLRARARGVQTHKQKVERVGPGSRVAVNLGGVPVDAVSRGQVLTTPSWLHPTSAFDARLRVLAEAAPLPHNATVSFHTGSAEVTARVRLLDADLLAPGEEGWVQLLLSDPVALTKGDLFVLRSPNATVGGGEVVETQARRHRRRDSSTLQKLAVLERGAPEELVIQALDGRAGSTLAEVIEKTGLSAEQVRALLVRLEDAAAVVALGERYRTAATIAALQETVEQELAQFHQRYPLRSGISREELRSRLHLPARDAAALLDHLAAQGVLVLDEAIARLASHQVTLSADQEERARRLVDDLDAQPFAPRSLDVLCQQYGIDAELLAALVARGAIVRVSEDIAFTASAFASLRQRILDHLGTAGAITVAEVRTMLDTSRKYALALMEYFDQQRLTRRVGDTRVLR